jgi:hypothetical protein
VREFFPAFMLVSDLFEVPHEKLADWTALIGSFVAYLVFATVVFYGLRIFLLRTRMRLLGYLFAAMILVAGLVGYFEVFVALDRATFSQAVVTALGETSAGHNNALLKRLTDERARSMIEPGGPIELRRIGFYLLPVIAVMLAAMIATARPEPSA